MIAILISGKYAIFTHVQMVCNLIPNLGTRLRLCIYQAPLFDNRMGAWV